MKLFPLLFLLVAGCAVFGPTGEERFLLGWVEKVDKSAGLIMVIPREPYQPPLQLLPLQLPSAQTDEQAEVRARSRRAARLQALFHYMASHVTLFLDEDVKVRKQNKCISREEIEPGDIIIITFEIPFDSPDQPLMREIEVIGHRASFCDCGRDCGISEWEAQKANLRAGVMLWTPTDCSCSHSSSFSPTARWYVRGAYAQRACGCPLVWGCRCAGGRIRY